MAKREGWKGWDTYAPFYDWENARTLGRKDVPFWTQIGKSIKGRVLELGCGTGRISLPLARAGVRLFGVDRSEPMLQRAAKRARSLKVAPAPARARRRKLPLLRADIRALPFLDASFSAVLAPYGLLQSLISDRDLTATLDAVARILKPGGVFGLDLVPDVPNWKEYGQRIQMRGKAERGTHLTLLESVKQDRKRRLTTFEQTYIERRGKETREHRFDLTFRTLPIATMRRRLEKAGFDVDLVLGDYQGGPWDERADVWIILARRRL